MAMVATDIKSMLSISIKSRHDSYTDQYNRIFMVKMLLVSSLIMGISWFQDSIHCMVPGIFQRLNTYLFCLVVWFFVRLFVTWEKSIKSCLYPGPFSTVLTLENLSHTWNRIWICAQLIFYLCLTNQFSSNSKLLLLLKRFIEQI